MAFINILLETYIISVIYLIFLYILFKFIILPLEIDEVINTTLTELQFYIKPNIINPRAKLMLNQLLNNDPNNPINVELNNLENNSNNINAQINNINAPYENNLMLAVILYCTVPSFILFLLIIFKIVDYNQIEWIALIYSFILNSLLIIGLEVFFLFYIFTLDKPIRLELPRPI
jgi:hypothetical protein